MARYSNAIRQAAQKYGLNPDLFHRQIMQESGGNPSAKSKAGAIGIAQIMPATAKGWGVNPNDPKASLDAAAKNMANYTRQYGGGTEGFKKALIAYNAGPGAVSKGSLPTETQNYIKSIMGGGTKGPALSAPRQPTPGSKALLTSLSGIADTGSTKAAYSPETLQQGKALALSNYLRDKGKPGAIVKLVSDVKSAEENAVTPAATASTASVTTTSGADQGDDPKSIEDIGKIAQSMGLHVGENPKFGGVSGSHVKGSFHYSGRAVDVSGDPDKMMAFNKRMAKLAPKLKELFYDPGESFDNGKKVGAIGGHSDHVHVAM